MINAILNGLLSFAINMINLLLTPIDSIISSSLPDFAEVLTSFNGFIDSIIGFFPWILSWFHIPIFLLTFVCSYLIAKLSISIVVHEGKILLAWYRKLVP